jgi:transposase
MLLSEGQMSDFKGAALMLSALPKAKELLADKGYDADWFRQTLAHRKIVPCIPSKSNRKVPIPHDALLYRQRHKIEIMFGRIKDWRRVHTRYDRCAHTYFWRSASLQRSSSGCDHSVLSLDVRARSGRPVLQCAGSRGWASIDQRGAGSWNSLSSTSA